MSVERLALWLLVLCAVAVALLAAGPFVYRALLPGEVGETPAGCSFLGVSTGLFVGLAAAAVWAWRRRQRQPEKEDAARR